MILNQSFYTLGCVHCSSFLVEPHLFCAFCFDQFIIPRIQNSFFQEVNRHVYLFEWNKSDDHFLAPLVYRLKAAQAPQAINFYSDLLAEKLIQYVDPSRFQAFIPVPGSAKKRVHSRLMANRLTEQTGLEYRSVLEKLPAVRQQKVLSSRERSQVNPFRLKASGHEEFTNKAGFCGPFIFVDDVLTTGQSIKHAESILGAAKPNAVATLFYRPPQ